MRPDRLEPHAQAIRDEVAAAKAQLDTLESEMTEHTCGPWSFAEMWRPPIGHGPHDGERLDANGNVFWGYSISGCNEHGGSILPTLAAVHNFPDQAEANARLISAAPDMLSALKRAIRELQASQKFYEVTGFPTAAAVTEDAVKIAVEAAAKAQPDDMESDG
jgi:hypothetical protein